jgi:diguanylate cyclase (GGDEF)-like protein
LHSVKRREASPELAVIAGGHAAVSRDPRERDLEIEQAQLRGFAHSFSEVEWLLLILVMLFLFVSQPDIAGDVGVVGILVAFAAFILLFRYTRVFTKRTAVKIAVEILVMVAFLTGVLGFAGGAASALTNLYLLPIITAALALGKRATALVMALVVVCYLLLGTFQSGGVFDTNLVLQAVGVMSPFILVAFLTTLLAENIHTAKARIRALSDRDELTMVYNMRAFSKLTAREHEAAARGGDTYAILMVDIDGLKAINDTYGHEAGNRAIQMVADALLRLTRSADIVARYGGDEFIVFLAHVDREVARDVAQRIRNVVFSTTLEVNVKIVRIKASVGVGTFPEDGNSVQAVMTCADRAMYKDKEARPPAGKLIIQKL